MIRAKIAPLEAVPVPADLLKSIQEASAGLTLAALMARHPAVARRKAQRWLSHWATDGAITAKGAGRARRYLAAAAATLAAQGDRPDGFPATIPLSADSRDTPACADPPLEARKPVGCQRDFLKAYSISISMR